MKALYLSLFLLTSMFANDGVHKFAKNSECKGCHTQIYNEYTTSMHANSTPQKDPIHNAIWNKHPQNLKQNRYSCAKCHSPTSDNLDKMMKKGEKAPFDAKNETHNEAVSCAYCHRIESIERHKMHNTNIISKDEKKYIATSVDGKKSDYHEIIKGNKMKSGESCIGCHSHKTNKHGVFLCSTDIDNKDNGSNCVSCHMPKVEGSPSNDVKRKNHSFHGFAGAHNNSEMLAPYVNMSVARSEKSFIVNIKNKASHDFLLHPLRVGVLKVKVKRGKEVIELKEEKFLRVLGKDGKPAMPWIANETIKNTMIKANEKRVVKYDFKLQRGDQVGIALGWYLVNPKVVGKLKLENEKVATKFNLFKMESYTIY